MKKQKSRRAPLGSRTKGREFPAGITLIDIVGGSEITKRHGRAMESTIVALKAIVESQLSASGGKTFLIWGGDGGVAVFDSSRGLESMVLFADRIRYLMTPFNLARGVLNHLPVEDVTVRIVCHAGNLRSTGSKYTMHGVALNELYKYGKAVEYAGHVVVSSEVYEKVIQEFRNRLQPSLRPRDERFGDTYVLDKGAVPSTFRCDDGNSTDLLQWIVRELSRDPHHQPYEQLLFFGHTLERLAHFLDQVKGLKVKVLCRNWLAERDDEDKFNKVLLSKCAPETSGAPPKPWEKSSTIHVKAAFLVNRPNEVELRFYDSPPIFAGAILVGPTKSCARVGIYRWDELPSGGGSQYKLREWPTICFDGRDEIQKNLIQCFKSRFEEGWTQGHKYEDVCRQEEIRRAHDPSNVGKVWSLDDQPYLIVYPHRSVPGRPFPVVASEDVMALRRLEDFLQSYDVKSKTLSIKVPNKLLADWYPSEAHNEIEQWTGHVVYICTKSIPPSVLKYLNKIEFPFLLYRDKRTDQPRVRHRFEKGLDLRSPIDQRPPEQRDYSIVAKFKREGKESHAYILAGLRAMGTWGAGCFLTEPEEIEVLAKEIGTGQFATIVRTSFDSQKYEITATTKIIGPEGFPGRCPKPS